jgi:glutamine synthetase
MLSALFTDLNGRVLEKRLQRAQVNTTHKPGFCHTVLLHSLSGSTVSVPGYGEDAGHQNAYLAFSQIDIRNHWRTGELTLANITDAYGEAHPLCSRTALLTAMNTLAQKGISLQAGIEIEFYLLLPEHFSYLRSTGQLPRQYFGQIMDKRIESVIDEIITSCVKTGVSISSFCREIHNLQYEFTLAPQSVLKSADDVVLFREIVRSVALDNGMHACFMAQVFDDAIGNGLHLNLSPSTFEDNSYAPDDKRWK